MAAAGTATGASPPGRSPGVPNVAGRPINSKTAPNARAGECGHSAQGVAIQAMSSVANRSAPRPSSGPLSRVIAPPAVAGRPTWRQGLAERGRGR